MVQLFKNSDKRKLISLLLVIFMVLPILPSIGVSATVNGNILIESDDYDNATGNVNYPRVIHLPGGSSRYPGAIVSSEDVVTSNGYYIDGSGEKIFAFCIDPVKPGAAEADGGKYYVSLSEKLTDKFEIAALRLSAKSDVKNIIYSGSSFANMDYWVNYAVKIVVKFYEMTGKNKAKTLEEINNLIQVSPPNGSSFIPAGDNNFGNKIIAAIKSAYNWIIANENASSASGNIELNCITSNLNELTSETEYGGTYKGEFEVKIDGSPDSKFKVSFEQGFGSHFSKFKLCDAGGVPFPDDFAHEFTNGDHFWIVGDLPELEPNQEYDEKHFIQVMAVGEFGEEYWIGKPADSNLQRYVFLSYSGESSYESYFTVHDFRPDELKFGSLMIGKLNSTTGQAVPGAKFLVEQIDGTYSTTVIVGSDGYYSLNDLPKGSYKITEIYVPKPLVIDPVPKTIYIDPETATEENPILVQFVNDQMTCVHIYKYDSKTNEPLNGAQFQLSRKDEVSAIFTGITGESRCSDCEVCNNPCNGDGVICFGLLDKGWYTVTEVNPEPGYLHDPVTPAIQTFEVTGKETQEIELKFDNKRRPELKIIKKDPDGNHLADVEFEIWKSGTQEKFSGKTDSNGEIYITWNNENYPLSEGSYSINEINVPAGYVLSDEVKEVMLVGNTLSEVVFVNPKRPGLTITKTDNEGNPLDGVVFEIWKSGTDTKYSAVTENGQIVLEWDNADFPLDEGAYSIRETAVPRGYLLDTTVKEALLENGKMVTIPFTNNKRPELEIVKINSNGEPLSGATFTIKRAGTTTEYELTTDSSGKIVIPYDSPLYPLEPDRYIVTEKVAPEHYLLSVNNIQEIVLEQNTRKVLTFENPEKPKLTIEKYDQRGDGSGNALPLSSVTFRIWKTDGSYDQTLTTGSDGKIKITDLMTGEYHIQEKTTKDGYVLNPEVRTVLLQGNDDVTVTFHNLKRPELLIVKLDSKTNKPLQGAHFQVSKGDEILFQDLMTDENGEILIPYNDEYRLLEEGTYKVTEIAPPINYDVVLPASKNVVLRNGERTRVEFFDIRKPTLIVTKLNALTQKPIPNTLYNIKWENPNGGVHDLGNHYTDKNGQIIFKFVEVGWYVVEEIKAAPGMTKAKNPITRIYLAPGTNSYSSDDISVISDGEEETILLLNEIETREYDDGDEYINTNYANIQIYADNPGIIIDYPLNSLIIKKEDATNGNLLAGAHFEIYRMSDETSGQSGTLIARVITGSSGVVAITGLEAGIYFVKEVRAPDNYTLNIQGVQTAYFVPDQTSNIEFTFSNYPHSGILITKVDAQTNKPLANARFRVTDASGAVAGSSNGEFSTNENGEIMIPNLKPGAYVVTEIEAPEYYVVDTTPQTVNVVADGEVYKVSFKNQPTGTLIIRKLDTLSKEPLADAQFKVTTSGGDVVGTSNGIFKTDATGTITIPHLPKGSYIIEEIQSPDGYILENQTQTIAIDYGKTYTLDFYNKKMSGLQIIKIDSQSKQPLKGAEFAVYKQNGEIVDLYVTDADGVIIIETLSPGWYKIVETKTIDGYVLDETPKDIQITANQFVKVVFENAPMSSLIIRKVDADTRDPLEGAEFTVKTASGTFIGVYRSGTDGMVSIPQIAPGWYTVTETKAPDGYTLGDNVQTIEITNTITVMIEFQNRAFGSLVIKKVDEITGDPLTGAEFSVYKQGGAFVGEYATGKDGTISISSVEPGWYTVSETKSPTGYTLDSTAKTVEVKPVVPTVVTFTNKALSGIEIIKTDSVTHNPLANATFVVERANGEKIGTYKTDVSGKVIVSGLTEGTYVVSETIAPDGYHLNETPKTVIVTSGKLTTIEFANKPHSGIQILKTDAVSNAPLKGAVFTIQRVNGERVGDKYTTDISGKIIVSDLEEGVYIISEIQAPNEYVLDAQLQTVEVKSGRLTIVEFTNNPYPYLHIVKTDASTGQLLSGAEFVVTNAYGEIIANVISQASGAVSIKVAPGVYTITEVKAPAGYENNDPVQTVEVRANGSAVYYGTSIAYPNNTAAFANRPLNAIQIIKLDSITHNPLSKALFMVEKSNGTLIGSFLTDSAGSVLISGLTEGTYVIKEVSAPSGYQLDETPKTISISGGGIVDVDFLNKPLSGIQITKLDAVTGQPLKDASFTVTRANGEKIGTFRTEADGTAVISDLEEGTYIVGETSAPTGYQLDETPKNVNVVSGRLATVEFKNKPFSGIQIIKTDAVTHVPLANATFVVDRSTGERIGIYKTDSAGQILVPDLAEGTYIVSETAAPNGYLLDQTPKTVTVVSCRITSVEFTNSPYGSLVIKKTDEITGRPLAGAHFTVTNQGGSAVGDFITDNDGTITVPNLEPGWYIVSETKAPSGYHLESAAKTIEIQSYQPTSITFTNRPYSGIEILKTDSVTHDALSGATFEITRANGEKIGTYRTDRTGKIVVNGLDEGVYIVSEVFAPDGYVRDELPKTVTVQSGTLESVEFQNKPYSGIEIIKIDYFSKMPLLGAVFSVERVNGEKIGEFTTDDTGKVIVSDLTDGAYIVSEIIAPDGYVISEQPKTVEVKSGVLTSVKFADKPLAGIEILKLDKFTHLPLSGATFEITKANGEIVGTFKSDKTGKVIVSDLEDGVYIVSEVYAPEGYQIDEVPKTVTVKSGKLTQVEFEDKPLASLKILKLNSITKEAIQGVEFTIAKMNGENIMNEFNSLTFKTDASGAIYVPRLTDGYYVVTEIKTAEGYFLDKEPKTVLVESGVDTVLEITNVPMSGLLVVKTDEQTGKPLAGAVYDIKRADGQFVAGTIMDANQPGTPNNSPSKSTSENGDITGSYTTDANGRIQINGLAAGQYSVVERKAPNDYELDTNVYSITVVPGKMATLQLTNKPKSGLRLVKIDSVTKKGIYNVEFMLFDRNNKVIGVYYTDNAGVIDFTSDISEGRYTIRETRAANGYYLDDMPKTVEFVAGKVTEIVWENTPQLGQIQILKKSADDNEINGLPAGTPLEGAIFEIYNYRTGSLVDRIVSGKDGRAVSNPLPLGRYVVKEVQSPKYYILSEKTLDIELEFATQIIKQEFLNYSANTGVSIRKTGNIEAMPNNEIRYDIKELRNTSTVPLTDFYWRDILPTNAVRLTKIVTGTFNQSLKYKVTVTTNKGDTRVIADNLSTTKNNVIDCSSAALGLKSDEYVTSFSVIFGTVKSGFSLVEIPQVYVKVLPNLQNGLEFANKCDVSGKYNGGEWIIGNSTWTTKIYNPQKLPKTGF